VQGDFPPVCVREAYVFQQRDNRLFGLRAEQWASLKRLCSRDRIALLQFDSALADATPLSQLCVRFQPSKPRLTPR
jgi:hypothetical protein